MFAALGLAGASGQAPLGFAFATVTALALAFGWVRYVQYSWKAVAWRGWALGFGYFSGSLFWIVEPFLVDAARHAWMAPFALIFLAGGLALFWGVAFGAAARLDPKGRTLLLWLIISMTIAEAGRGVVLTGFPWAQIGHVWVGWPQMQIAALTGANGLTLLTVSAAAAAAWFGRRVWFGAAAAAVLLLAVPLPYAAIRLSGDIPEREVPVTVRLLQPNAPQHQKWDPEHIPKWFDRQLDLSAATGDAKPDLVVWPETAVPFLLEDGSENLRIMADAASAPVVFGAQRWHRGRARNSLAVISAGGQLQTVYDKSHLVPFGEYVPLSWIFGRLGITGLATLENSGYAPGPGLAPVDLGGPLGAFLPLICYEAIFPQDIRRAVGAADWILHITNDAWFGTQAGPYQHLAQARLRAVETGLPVLRSANTGVSAAINAHGQILDQLPLNTHGKLDVVLPGSVSEPLYAKWGEGLTWLMVLMLLVIGVKRRLMKVA